MQKMPSNAMPVPDLIYRLRFESLNWEVRHCFLIQRFLFGTKLVRDALKNKNTGADICVKFFSVIEIYVINFSS